MPMGSETEPTVDQAATTDTVTVTLRDEAGEIKQEVEGG